MTLLGTWPVMKTTGEESIIAVAIPGHQVRRARPRRRHRDSDFAGGPRVTVRHVRRALLVAHEHVVNPRLEKRVVDGQDGAPRVAEDVSDRLVLERIPDDLSPRAFHGLRILPTGK